jgi:hypothetical protein
LARKRRLGLNQPWKSKAISLGDSLTSKRTKILKRTRYEWAQVEEEEVVTVVVLALVAVKEEVQEVMVQVVTDTALEVLEIQTSLRKTLWFSKSWIFLKP